MTNSTELIDKKIESEKGEYLLSIENINVEFSFFKLETYLKKSLEPFFSIRNEVYNGKNALTIKCFIDEKVENYADVFNNSEQFVHFSPSIHENFYKKKCIKGNNIYYRALDTSTVIVENVPINTINIIATSSNLCKEVKRILRDQILYGQLEKEGAIPVHAASVKRDNKGIIILGDKGYGKTSTSLSLLNGDDTSFICNDLSFLKFVNGIAKVKGTPESPRIGIGTLFQHAQLRDYIPSAYKQFEKDDPKLWEIDSKVEIEWDELAEIYGARLLNGWNKVDIALFPHISKDYKEIEIKKFSKNEFKTKLLENVLSPYMFNMEPWLACMKTYKGNAKYNIQMMIEKLSETIIGYQVNYSGNITTFNGKVDALIGIE
ncbi:hypothetical protein MUB24_13940 [Lederbergia sp. NSJ-179]|uniref:hypothetical protein n=1 Tax=Lederbergia sp. NSJ-179 TaxID=2931402 RepID=UPI001FD5774F|nr:hypothetical protein [Lederbergia sp. NSJ-179]MCJ7841981.1 hypothetical protein [Lederbergia sp. NSJ-179]